MAVEGDTCVDMAEPSYLRAHQGIKGNGATFGQSTTLLRRVCRQNNSIEIDEFDIILVIRIVIFIADQVW